MDSKTNQIWRKYEKCHAYIQQKNLVSKTESYWNNYLGYQWKGVGGGGSLESKLPVQNFIKPTVKYKVSSICQHSMIANYSDIKGRAEDESIFKMLNDKFSQSWEKGKLDTKSWQCVKEAAIQGDSYLYWGSGDTLESPQVIANTSILLGDENISDIQKQPYILIVERLGLERVKEIARMNKLSDEEIANIAPDKSTEDVILNKEEVSDKVTVILYMEKTDEGIVRHARATKQCIIEPFNEATLTKAGEFVKGMNHYPIVNFIWEEKPNNARGVGEVEQLIPNQIEHNKTLARRAETVKLTAFPRIAYDGNAIENPSDLEKVGAPIKVVTGGAQSINQAIAYLNAANISNDAKELSEDLLEKTRELAGAGDVALGNINPERASGNAIVAVRDQTQIPLNEQVSRYSQFVETIALLWFDLWTTYDPEGFVIEGEEGEEQFPVEELLRMKPSVRIDVSQDNQWTKLAEQQAVDNLLTQNHISFEEYALLVPSNGAISKGKLEQVVLKRQAMQQQMMEQQQVEQQMMEEQMLNQDENQNVGF